MRQFIKPFIFSLSLFFLVSCSNSKLTVYNQTLNQQFLASFHAKTPDPRNTENFIGQRLVVRTSVSEKQMKKHHFLAKVHIQYGNRSQKTIEFILQKGSNDFIIALMNEEFKRLKGMTTYKVELFKDGQLDDQFEHQLWSKIIDLDDENASYDE